jgi:RNA polymerase sigma-70 factor, ECF subfamily
MESRTISNEIIDKIQNGDELAFKEMVESKTSDWIALVIRIFRVNEHDAKDIVQSALIKIWKKIKSFRKESSFDTWAYVIVRNEAFVFLKNKNCISKKESSLEELSPEIDEEDLNFNCFSGLSLEETASNILETKEDLTLYREMIEGVLCEMSDEHHEIIRLVLEQEKSYQEVAKELDIPVGTVMSRLFFARKRAQKLITNYARKHDIRINCLGECK